MASSSSHLQENEEHHALLMASSSSPPQKYAFSGASSSSFYGIEPPHERRKVSESSRLYDVFINHRGPDVKDTLALELHKSLENLEIRAFLDSKEKVLGDSFPSTIETAIHSAAVHIAIFSKGYAESPWCLKELVLMLQSKAKIVPVFYGVAPSALRHIEKGVYAKAFIEYENKKRYIEELEEWRKALHTVSFIGGEEFTCCSDCEKIVSAVQKEVQRMRCLHVAKYPVGLPKLVQHFEKQCIDKFVQDFESQCRIYKQGEGKCKMVGIFGMGGVGKTTLAKEFFNRKRSDYSRSCFLFDVREASVKKDLPSVQMKLLRELFDENDHTSFPSVEDGTSCLSNRFARTDNPSFLIVLDDIDHQEQLDALVISDELNKFGNSLVIVTTRDVKVLINAEITVGYNLKGMDRDDAKELFCWHAFSRSYPSSGYEELVDLFVDVCGGLPLSIQVLGRHVHGEDQNFWELELKKVKKTLPQDIQKRLRISIDTLDNEEKQIFMDVACFFIGEYKKDAIRVWEGSGWSAQHALRRLKDKCLVEEMEDHNFIGRFGHPLEYSREEKFVLRMHDHLRDLGREMADELSHPRRLWRSEYRKPLLSKGIKNIFTQTKGRCLYSFVDRSMYFYIKYFLRESDNMAEKSSTLLWLEVWFYGRTLTDFPPWVPLQNLQILRIGNAALQRLWQKEATFPLKDLRICGVSELKELNLELLRCLEEITIHDCEDLKSLTGISDLTKLVELNISKCGELEDLSFVPFSRLKRIAIHDCGHLKSVTGISDLTKLVELNISSCEKIEELSLARLSCLEVCFIRNLSMLKTIEVKGCKNLLCVEGIFENLVKLNIRDCPKLKKITGIKRLHSLERMQLLYCRNEIIQDCILKMEKAQSEFIQVIGRAVDGAETILNANLFCEFICANSVIQIGSENHLGRHVLSAIILCAVVVINTCTAAKTINDFIGDCDCSPWLKFEVHQGEWVITSVTTREDEINSYILNKGYCLPFDYLSFSEDVMVKRLDMPVMKGGEHKILNVLSIIADKLYQK